MGLAYSTWVGMMESAEEVKSALRGTDSCEEERNIACSTHEASLVLPPCCQASLYPLDQALFRYKLLASANVSLDDPAAQSDESRLWGARMRYENEIYQACKGENHQSLALASSHTSWPKNLLH